MTDGTISVAITGKDTLSPALTAVEERLARSRVALNASGAVADQFRTKIAALHAEYASGKKGAIEYDRELGRLERQFRQTSEAITTFSAQTTTATAHTNQVVGTQARNWNRLTFGIQSAALAFDNGRVSIQGLSSALMGFAASSGGAIAAFTAVAVAIDLIARNAKTAETRIKEMTNALVQETPQAIEGRLSLARNRLASFPAGSTDRHGEEATTVVFIGGKSYTRAELVRYIEALERAQAIRQGMEPSATGRTRSTSGRADSLFGGTPKNDKGVPGSVDLDIVNLAGELKALLGSASKGGAFDGLRDELKALKDDLKLVEESALSFGDAFATGFGAAIDAAMNGGNVLRALTSAVLGELSREARAKAVFELAEGFAALFNPVKGGPAAAAAHFKSAALYGAVAVGSGVMGGGGGSGGPPGGRPAGGFGGTSTGTTERAQQVIVIQVVAQTTGEVVREYQVEAARYAARGGAVPGASAIRVPLEEAQVIVGRGFR